MLLYEYIGCILDFLFIKVFIMRLNKSINHKTMSEDNLTIKALLQSKVENSRKKQAVLNR
jgi:hypothetical protein